MYNWAHYIPADVIADFEKEMKVTVFYDVFETLETLEAKLLAARSGYDVVFPAAWPTVALFIPSGAFLKLDLTQLPNRRFVDPDFMKKLATIDPENNHVMPYLWGTTGLAYNTRALDKLAPDAPRDSWGLVFDPHWTQKLERGHITLLDSAADVFPTALLYLGKDPNAYTEPLLAKASDTVLAVRPWVTKFDSSQALQDLMSGHVAVAQVFSSYGNIAARATRHAKKGPRIVYIIPKEGALMWMDVIAIPKDAPNQKLAHAFINFLMRPDIIARITNQIQTANAIPSSKAAISQEIVDNPGIYPPADVMAKIVIDQLPPRAYQRTRLRLWTRIKTGH
jgi:putrescine transport system substrate-binding protein